MKTPKFDPSRGADDEFIDQQNGELYEALMAELKGYSKRWKYDQIDYCWTGKDADLEPWGYQGLHIDSIDDSFVTATVHTGKTVCGHEVCLNLPEDATEAQQDRALGIYLEQATEVVCGCGCPGEWDGEDWWMSDQFPIKAKTVLNPETGKLDTEETIANLYNAAQTALEDWDKEMTLMDDILSVLAGWRDSKGDQVPEGKPTEGSVWDTINWEKVEREQNQ